jgi:hypothetical protein
MKDILVLKDRLDVLYNEVLSGNKGILDDLDSLLLEILKYDDLSLYNEEEIEQITLMIRFFTEKINIIYSLLDVDNDNLLTIDNIRNEFKLLEMKRFNIVNSYVMGIVKIEDINLFRDALFQFRDMLSVIPISDDNILEIARMKSKIQHFNTEVLEDEDMLKQAYSNSN